MSHKDGSPTCAPATVGPSQKALPPLASVAVAGAACAGAAVVQALIAAASAARRNRMRHDRTQGNARAHLTFGRRRPRPSGQIACPPDEGPLRRGEIAQYEDIYRLCFPRGHDARSLKQRGETKSAVARPSTCELDDEQRSAPLLTSQFERERCYA